MDLEKTKDRTIAIIPGCIMCKTCECLAPTLFLIPEDQLTSTTLKPGPEDSDELEELKDAIRNCPVHVITYRRPKRLGLAEVSKTLRSPER